MKIIRGRGAGSCRAEGPSRVEVRRALAAGCAQLHLDSGVQREKAHRFYFREGMGVNAYHFRIEL